MENFQGIHASVITALRCSKTRVWNSAGLQIFSLTPELQTRNSTGLQTLNWNAIRWQNSRPGIPPDSRTLIPDPPDSRTLNPESTGIRNSASQLPGIPVDSGRNPNWTWNSAGIPPEFRTYFY